jgi:hypothetical protein
VRQEADFAQVRERLLPQRLEAASERGCEGFVVDQEGREADLGYERMVEREHDVVVVEHVEGMTDLAVRDPYGYLLWFCQVVGEV